MSISFIIDNFIVLLNILKIIYKMSDRKKLLVIALGGNALLDSKSKGTIEEREAAAEMTAEQLFPYFNLLNMM